MSYKYQYSELPLLAAHIGIVLTYPGAWEHIVHAHCKMHCHSRWFLAGLCVCVGGGGGISSPDKMRLSVSETELSKNGSPNIRSCDMYVWCCQNEAELTN